MEFLKDRKVSYKETEEFNGDGTPGITGHQGGLIALFEEHVEHPVQWSVCFLHHLERPWLRLFLHLDGKSLGPESFSGPIGKEIVKDVHKLPVTAFEKIEVEDGFPVLPESVLSTLSKDQKDIYNLCVAVICGNCPEKVAKVQIGRVCLHRWLTTGSRVIETANSGT